MLGTHPRGGAWEGIRRTTSAGVWALLALLPMPVLAQAGEPGAATDPVELAPVTVTARLRPELEQQVPASMAVVSGEALAEEGRFNLGDLDSRVANLQIGDLNGVPTIFMRGVGGGGRQVGFDPRTGLYIDGVFMNQPPLADGLLLDLDRVEVLRGPQGSLFGQNMVSGAISLVTKEPSERPGVEGLLRLDDRGERRFGSALDLPMIEDRLLFRVSTSLGRGDGLTTNRFDGSKPDAFKEAGARARLQWRIAPGLRADFSADTATHSDGWPTGEARGSSGGGPDANPGAYSVAYNTPQQDDVRSSGLAATLNWDSPFGKLTSISAWRLAQRHWVVDLDYSPLDAWVLDYTDRYQRWSQELRLGGRSQSLPLSWLAGAYAFRQISDSDRLLPAGPDIGVFIPPASPGDNLVVRPRLDSRSAALFGTVGYALRPDLRLDAGLRLVTVNRRLDYSQLSSGGFAIIGNLPVLGYEKSASENAVLPDLALSWDLSPTLTTYVRYAMGSKAGGFDADTIGSNRTVPGEFADETVNSYELGLKSQWLQRRLRANLALFLADYEDYQVSQFRPVGAVTVPVVSNAGKVRTYGPELELLARPLRGLTLRSSTAWVYAEYVEFRNGGGPGVDFSGRRAEYAPRWTSHNAIEYRRPVDWGFIGAVQGALSYSWRSRFYTQPSNLPPFHADTRSLLGARLGVQDATGRWELTLYGDNLLDDRYTETLSRATLGALYGRYGAPRTFGVQLQVRYD